MIRVVVLTFVIVQPLAAQDEIRWKWRADDTFYVRTITRVKQTLLLEDSKASVARAASYLSTVAGPVQAVSLDGLMTYSPPLTLKDRELKQEYQHTSWLRYKVSKRNEDGSAILLQRVVKDYNEIKSAEGVKPDNTLDDVELTLHVDPRGIVTKVEGGDALLERLSGNDSGKREALREALSADSLKASTTQALGVMPPKAVKAGDKWDVPGELKLGAIGKVKLERAFTLDSVTDRGATKVARLSFTTRVSDYQPAKTGGNAFRILEGTLGQAEGKGTVEVDLDAGRLREAGSTLKLRGHLSLLNTNTVYRVRLDQEQSVTLTVHDRLPVREEPKP